mmetsp:Transcript_36282/g.43826  ORF Transcript_36282/g.43826 Transcript_36282/m.43826 type:complete len:559 (-) Transcript_36282:435-2111(-)|eukprot:CAMPEP_0197863158 /NCGR_PEP_ID=MMETSP1438-20131217/40430_1 /TAXON_ID=1461541 /ORGANISM="Pterosperma sp., Strain CCMP1384" /LENGTH=558 /DNA_ID=CAMNT_0043480961 /DNA_START=166 /DNA_END=1842 /DNA_ORIENTATION=+
MSHCHRGELPRCLSFLLSVSLALRTASGRLDFQYVSEAASWEDARNACKAGGGSLANIHSASDQAAVASLMQEKFEEIRLNAVNQRAAWIGYSDIQKEGRWDWVDKSTQSSYTAWGGAEPNSWGDEDCAVTTNIFGWLWADYDCNLMQGFICQGLKNVDAAVQRAKEGKNLMIKAAEAKGLTYINLEVTYYDAVAACDAGSGTLAMIKNDKDQDALKALMVANSDQIEFNQFGQMAAWIGATDSSREGKWKYTDGSRAHYAAWGGNEPNSYGDEDCAVTTGAYHWKWADYSCNYYQGFVCHGITSKNEVVQFAYSKMNERTQSSSNYGYKLVDTPMTYVDARDTCKVAGGNLAGIHSFAMQEAFTLYMTGAGKGIQGNKWGQQAVWIGLSDMKAEGKWIWQDGTRSKPGQTMNTFWGGDEPNSMGDEDCAVALKHLNWKWGDYPCDLKQPFVCSGVSNDKKLPASHESGAGAGNGGGGVSKANEAYMKETRATASSAHSTATVAAVFATFSIIFSGATLAIVLQEKLGWDILEQLGLKQSGASSGPDNSLGLLANDGV